MKKKLNNSDKIFFEVVSNVFDIYSLTNILKLHNFKLITWGASCVVISKPELDYVIKLGDRIDKPPRRNSKLNKYFAKILWSSKNKKILIQEKVEISDDYDILIKLSNELKIKPDDLNKSYDAGVNNIGLRNNKIKIVDYRNYKSHKKIKQFSSLPTWYNVDFAEKCSVELKQLKV